MNTTSKPLTCLLIGPILAMAFSLSFCTGVPDPAESNDFKVQLATQYATLKYVETSDGAIDREKASRVYDRALDIESHVDKSTSVSVSALESYLVNQVDWQSLAPSDATAARLLISYLSRELEERVDKKRTDEEGKTTDTTVVVGFFVDTVKNTLEPYRL